MFLKVVAGTSMLLCEASQVSTTFGGTWSLIMGRETTIAKLGRFQCLATFVRQNCYLPLGV